METTHHQKLLQLGLQDGKMVFISDVENGAKCNCKCPNCGEGLIAKNNGKRNLAHFAHESESQCAGAVESAIHRAAKEIFLATKTILLPACYREGPYGFKKYIDTRLLTFDYVEIEKSIQIGEQIIIPDAIGHIQGKSIFIEFAFTHFIDENKLQVLQASQIPCIEIDLRYIGQGPNSIKEMLINGKECKSWICNPKIDSLVKADYKKAERKKTRD